MQFYSGFSLKNEEHFFRSFQDTSAYCVSGFSYGAIKAFKEVKESIANGKRVDRLQLFSPAFFQTKAKKFKRLQELAYAKSKDSYLHQFLEQCFHPYALQNIERDETRSESLRELLNFEWIKEELEALESQGIAIEVYLGGKDSIINAKEAEEFFLRVATVTYIKNANHFLQIQ